MEKDFLQSLKIEISKNFKLVPYERMAFHKILGIIKSENGARILMKELSLDPDVRRSAVAMLKSFDQAPVTEALIALLKERDTGLTEKLDILDHLLRVGSPADARALIAFIESHMDQPESAEAVAKAFVALRERCAGSEEVKSFLSAMASDREKRIELRCSAIEALASFRDIHDFETFMKEQNDEISFSTLTSLAILADILSKQAEESRAESEIPYTYAPELEDRLVVDIRVLLGKTTASFDSLSKKCKVAFINAMICCNHREFIIYTMKALTSEDEELEDLVLHLLLSNVNKLRDPDKLFRNLLALPADTERKNSIIVSIFERYFSSLKESRHNMLMRDKLYNYFVVTLDSYFETYRKEFMITEVREKEYPESFRKIRRFVLERLNPDIKKQLLYTLRNGDRASLKVVSEQMARYVPYISADDREHLFMLIEMLYERDQKSRANSATRLESLNYEKRYLRNRIVRMCDIIGRLKIMEAASPLVKIFNYVKKYRDDEIFDAVAYCLSMLNYSYMLGELEILLSAGDERDRPNGIKYLSLFSDQRSLNILLDFIRERVADESGHLVTILSIFQRRDLSGNTAINSVMKKIAEGSEDAAARIAAVYCLGKTALDSDIDYLNEMFLKSSGNDMKEAILQALSSIIQSNSGVNRRQVIKYLTEYMKDPSIRVRIYASTLLVHLGNKDAMKSIRDMMIIKNKSIQREILNSIGALKSVEFSYFLISLMKEEYAVSSDVLPILTMLPAEELQEIDHFIVNIFKKYEGAEMELLERKEQFAASPGGPREAALPHKTIVRICIQDYRQGIAAMNIGKIFIVNRFMQSIIVEEIVREKGVICRITDGIVIANFGEATQAADAVLRIHRNITRFNEQRLTVKRTRVSIQVITEGMQAVNDEIMVLPESKIEAMNLIPVVNRVIVDEGSKALLAGSYHCEGLPAYIMARQSFRGEFFELISPVNTAFLMQQIMGELNQAEQDKVSAQINLEAEIKKRKIETKSASAIEYVKVMDEIGKLLKQDMNEVMKYVQKRSTDREMIANVEKMLTSAYKRYLLESTKLMM
ncbi:MAG: hypothetical protein EPN93_08650 [Spirochaetes bacterium]|nr:MAG: hypothetical protein EPN93_08650 [Spirochaetota bacterium]